MSKPTDQKSPLPPPSPKHPSRLQRSPSMSTVSASPSRIKMYSSIKFKANIQNFNGSNKNHILSSPRSVQACKRHGIDPKKLYAKTMADIRASVPDRLKGENELLKKKLEWSEKKRLDQIEIAKQQRLKIIREEQLKDPNRMKSTILADNDKLKTVVIFKERQQLSGIQKRQQKELTSLIESEMGIQNIKKQTQLLVEKQKERERQLEQEKKKKKQEYQVKRIQIEQEKRKKYLEQQEQQRLLQQRMFEKQQQVIKQQKQLEIKRQIQKRKKEEERQKKKQEYQQYLAQIAAQNERQIQIKKAEYERRDKERIEMLQKQREEKRIAAERKQKEMDQKLKINKIKKDKILIQQKEKIEQKNKQRDIKMKYFEQLKQEKRKQMKEKFQIKNEQIKRIIEQNLIQEEAKKQKIMTAIEEAEVRKKQLEMEREKQIEQRKEIEKEKERQRLIVLQRMKEMQEEQQKEIMEKIKKAEELAQEAQRKQKQELLRKQTLQNMKRQQKEEAVKKLNLIQDYHRERLMKRLEEDNQKAELMKREKKALVQYRRELRNEIIINKYKMKETVTKLKNQGKLIEKLTDGSPSKKPDSSLIISNLRRLCDFTSNDPSKSFQIDRSPSPQFELKAPNTGDPKKMRASAKLPAPGPISKLHPSKYQKKDSEHIIHDRPEQEQEEKDQELDKRTKKQQKKQEVGEAKKAEETQNPPKKQKELPQIAQSSQPSQKSFKQAKIHSRTNSNQIKKAELPDNIYFPNESSNLPINNNALNVSTVSQTPLPQIVDVSAIDQSKAKTSSLPPPKKAYTSNRSPHITSTNTRGLSKNMKMKQKSLSKSYLMVGIDTSNSRSHQKKLTKAQKHKSIAARRSTEPYSGFEDTYGASNYHTIGEQPAPTSNLLPQVMPNSKQMKKPKADRHAGKVAALKRKQMQELREILQNEEEKDKRREKRIADAVSQEQRQDLENEFGIERAAADQRLKALSERHQKEIRKILAGQSIVTNK